MSRLTGRLVSFSWLAAGSAVVAFLLWPSFPGGNRHGLRLTQVGDGLFVCYGLLSMAYGSPGAPPIQAYRSGDGSYRTLLAAAKEGEKAEGNAFMLRLPEFESLRWRYRVNPAVVGKKFGDLPKTEMLVYVEPIIGYRGIRVDGHFVRTPIGVDFDK